MATTRRTRRWRAWILLPEHRLPLVSDGRLRAGDESGDRPCEHDGRPAAGRLRLPGRDAAQSQAGSHGGPGADGVVERQLRALLPATGVPVPVVLPREPGGRAVARRSRRNRRGVEPCPDLRADRRDLRQEYRDYPVASKLPSVSLANIGDTFDVREILFPLTSAGRGDAYGVELFVEKRLTSKIYGQTNLAFSRTRHAALDGVMRPGSFDYPFVFNVTGGYRLTEMGDLHARRGARGRPYTPYDEAVSSAQYRGIYDLTRVNGERGPAYARIDVRVDRTFAVGGRPFNRVLRRPEPHEPPQLRRLQLESPDQCARRQTSSRGCSRSSGSIGGSRTAARCARGGRGGRAYGAVRDRSPAAGPRRSGTGDRHPKRRRARPRSAAAERPSFPRAAGAPIRARRE